MSSMSFGCAHYLEACPKAVSSGYTFYQLIDWVWNLDILNIDLMNLTTLATNSSCHPTICTTQYAIPYLVSHITIIQFLTNTLFLIWNSGTGYVRNWFTCLSLDIFMLLMGTAYMSLRTSRARSLLSSPIYLMSGFNNCTNGVYASFLNMRMNVLSFEYSFGTKLYAAQAIWTTSSHAS